MKKLKNSFLIRNCSSKTGLQVEDILIVLNMQRDAR